MFVSDLYINWFFFMFLCWTKLKTNLTKFKVWLMKISYADVIGVWVLSRYRVGLSKNTGVTCAVDTFYTKTTYEAIMQYPHGERLMVKHHFLYLGQANGLWMVQIKLNHCQNWWKLTCRSEIAVVAQWIRTWTLSREVPVRICWQRWLCSRVRHFIFIA